VQNLNFDAEVPGTIKDTNGLGSGFTHQLPKSGDSIPENDPNLNLTTNPKLNGSSGEYPFAWLDDSGLHVGIQAATPRTSKSHINKFDWFRVTVIKQSF